MTSRIETQRSQSRAKSALLAAGTALILAVAADAADLNNRISLDIPAQPLGSALLKFAKQAGIQVTVATESTAGLQAPALHGDYPAQEALSLLLRGTGLSYHVINERTVAIHRGQSAVEIHRPARTGQQAINKDDSIETPFLLAQQDQPATDAAAQPAAAQSERRAGELEEIIVTAQKRQENLQNVPIAITALTSTQLENRGITSFEGIARSTPSISFVPFPSSSNTFILYMRGQGNANPAPVNAEGAVGLYVDGFYIARPQANTFDMADIERVEVLRGPQGTLYGRNTTGGAVNLVSKLPTGEFGFKQSLDFGNRNMFRSLTAVNLPKWGDLSAKITVLKSSIDGYVKNAGSSHDYGEEAQQAGRLQLSWEPADNFRADYFFEKGDLDSTPIYYQNASLEGRVILGYPYTHASSPRRTTYRPIDLPLSTARFTSNGLTMTWDINDSFTLKSLTGYREVTSRYFQDYAEAFTAAPGFSITNTTEDFLKSHQFSQELQAIGSLLDNRIT